MAVSMSSLFIIAKMPSGTTDIHILHAYTLDLIASLMETCYQICGSLFGLRPSARYTPSLGFTRGITGISIGSC